MDRPGGRVRPGRGVDRGDGLPRQPREPRGLGRPQDDAALAALESTRSHFDRREAICALAAEAADGASPAEIAERADRLLASEAVIQVHAGADPLAPTYYTTPRTWEAERRFVEIAERGREAGAATVDEATLDAVLECHRYLGDDQRAMVGRLLRGGERIVPVAALPGTGKTTALAAAREAWEAAGHPVIGVATARSAAGELADAGIPSTSIAKLLIRAEELRSEGLRPLREGTVILADESSTTSTPDSLALAELATECGGKLVEVGDPRQIGAIGPGGLYGHLTQTIEPSVLTEIRRQRAEVDREIVRLAHEGRGSDALDLLRAEERLSIAYTQAEAMRALALDWHRSFAEGEDAVMIARRNRDVAELNAQGRELLLAEGRLGGEEIEVAGRRFAVGDRVITRVNTPHVSNRERWEVTALDTQRREVELARIGGEERGVMLGARYLDYRTAGGEPPLQHAYAISTYAAESKTFERAFSLLDAGASREEFLVSVSRSRGPTHAYGVAALELTDAELGPGSRSLEDAAHDLRAAAERPGEEVPALATSQRQRVAAMGPAELAQRIAELEERADAAERSSPGRERLETLDRWIEESEGQLAELRRRYADLLAEGRPEAMRVEDLRATGAEVAQRLEGLAEQRRGLVEDLGREEQLRPLSPAERLELSLLEDRIRDLCRREVAAERLDPSPMVLEALGERPREALGAAAWNEGVDAIYSYRYRHALGGREAGPLGAEPDRGRKASDWREAQRRVERARAVMERSRGFGLSVEPEAEMEL